MAAYYERRFNVTLDPDSETIVTLGSKEGLANLAQAITSPGDIVLAPNPSYPIHAFGFIIAGGSVRHIPCEPDHTFLEALDRGVRHSVPKPIAVVLNYPSNPTALVADLDFYGQVVDFCRHHGIWILSDLAYSEIYFNDTSRRPRSWKFRARARWRWSSPRCPRATTCPAGASASPPATAT